MSYWMKEGGGWEITEEEREGGRKVWDDATPFLQARQERPPLTYQLPGYGFSASRD